MSGEGEGRLLDPRLDVFYEEVAILGKTIHEETAINVFFNEEVAILGKAMKK